MPLLTPLNTDFAGRQFADWDYPAPGCGTVRFFWSSTQAEVDWRLASLGVPKPGEWIFGDYEAKPYIMDTWPHFTAVVEFWRQWALKARAAGWTKVGMCSLYPMTRLWKNIGALDIAECNAYLAERLWPVLDGATTECYGEPSLGGNAYRGCMNAITDAGLIAFALLHPYSWKTGLVASPAACQRAIDNALVDAPGGTILWQDAGLMDLMPPTGFSERRLFDLMAVRAHGLDEKQPWFEDILMAREVTDKPANPSVKSVLDKVGKPVSASIPAFRTCDAVSGDVVEWIVRINGVDAMSIGPVTLAGAAKLGKRFAVTLRGAWTDAADALRDLTPGNVPAEEVVK